MIMLTRRQARRLRGVLRRHSLGITHRGPVPPVVFHARETELRVQYQHAALAIEVVETALPGAAGTIALPLDALAELAGRDESAVALEPLGSDRTIVRWTDHGVPQTREYAVPGLDTLEPLPASPLDWTPCPSGLLTTFAEACLTASEDATRYALNCIQLRGNAGEVAATDGHQLLLQGGLPFPWAEDLLVRRSSLFAGRVLPHDPPVAIGRTGSHVVLRVGPWTVFLEIQTGGRFPVLGHVIPDPSAPATRLQLDPEDVRFVGETLDRLPGSNEEHAPATLDLNGQVAIRARGADQAQSTELVLARSRVTGPPVRLTTNRELLNRALRLGFAEVEILDADSPIVCRDRDRVFCWQPLAKESALEPSEDAIRIESASPTVEPVPSRDVLPRLRTTESTRSRVRNPAATCDTGEPEGPGPAGLAVLIAEAEALHRSLAEARGRAGRLVVALRRQRRRERLVNSTLASLRALKLQDVAG